LAANAGKTATNVEPSRDNRFSVTDPPPNVADTVTPYVPPVSVNDAVVADIFENETLDGMDYSNGF
jgi:hypothetical protein